MHFSRIGTRGIRMHAMQSGMFFNHPFLRLHVASCTVYMHFPYFRFELFSVDESFFPKTSLLYRVTQLLKCKRIHMYTSTEYTHTLVLYGPCEIEPATS